MNKSTNVEDTQGLSSLGRGGAAFSGLEVFPSHSKPGDLEVTLTCTEFTCRCPVTNQPDWADIIITYTAHERVLESKSLKLYLETFRERGIFHEHIAQIIYDDFYIALQPSSLKVTVEFNTRGGIAIDAVVGCKL